MKLNIIEPHQVIYRGEVISVSLPSEEGEITVLPNHLPLISSLKRGKIKIKIANQNDFVFEIEKGVVEVTPNEVNVLVLPS